MMMKVATVLLAVCASTASGFAARSMQNSLAGGDYAPVSPESVYPEYGPGSEHAAVNHVLPQASSVNKGWGSGAYNAMYKSMQNDLAAGDYEAISPGSTYPAHVQKKQGGFYEGLNHGPKHSSMQSGFADVADYAPVSPESVYPEYMRPN